MAAALVYNRVPEAGLSINHRSPVSPLSIYLLALATALMMGLRYEVGGDWYPYLLMYDLMQLLSSDQLFAYFDPGYAVVGRLSNSLGLGIYGVNVICGIIMAVGIAYFCARQPNPALTFLVGVPYLIIVVGMGYTRQGVAIGIIIAGIAGVSERTILRTIFIVCVAALFHKTALLVLPFIMAPILRRNLLYAVIGGIVFVGMFYVLLADSADQMVTNYVDAGYESSGAVIRVMMNVIPALLALLFRKRLGLNDYHSDMWSVFAIVSLLLVPLVLVANFTTAIDRMALFLIPLQIAVLPRIPYIFGHRKALNAQLFLAICGYSAMVQMVWIVFADNSRYWLPYRMAIFEL